MAEQAAPAGWLKGGYICGVFGVKGWVKVFSNTDPLENLLKYRPWLIGRAGEWQEIELVAGKRHGKTLIAQPVGCEDREQAQLLVGSEIAVPETSLPKLRRGEFYWADLIGMDVTNEKGESLGRVERLMATGSNDVLVVKGERERLIPWVKEHYVLDVDLNERRIVVDWEADY